MKLRKLAYHLHLWPGLISGLFVSIIALTGAIYAFREEFQDLSVKDVNNDFFRWIIQGHYYLWLPPKIGQPLVTYTTVVFLLVLLSGFIIWVPKSLKGLKKSLKFKWKHSTKTHKKVYDLHVILGIYAAVFALIFVVTGLVWGFQWFADALSTVIEKSKLLKLNYDIHTGSIWGLPGKFLAFVSSLLIASFPVTGFLMWWRKKRKSLIKKNK